MSKRKLVRCDTCDELSKCVEMQYIYRCPTGHTTIKKRYLINIDDFVKGQYSYHHRQKIYEGNWKDPIPLDFFTSREARNIMGSKHKKTSHIDLGHIKRTYFITDEMDIAINKRAIDDRIDVSELVQRIFSEYFGLDKKKK